MHTIQKIIIMAATLCLTSTVFAANTTPPVSASPTPQAVVATTPAINTQQPVVTPTPPTLSAKGFVLMDANTGMILAHKNMHQRMEPASLTKLMTLYVTSQALAQGQIKLTDQVRVSDKAWKTGGSRMFIKAGSLVTVKDLIDGVIVASGNDACVALAQYVGGNEATFVDLMNQTAQQLGMKDTHFFDSTGLPNPAHYTTAYDMALLTRAIITHFPEDYAWYNQKWITYNNIKQPNRNRLLWRDNAVDGLKTGHTDSAGYCLVASAKHDDTRFLSVVMGAPTDEARANNSEALLNWGFRFYQTHKLYDGNQALATPRVWLGENKTVPVGLDQPLYVTIPAGNYAELKPSLNIATTLKAPIKKGQAVGAVTVTLQNNTVTEVPLIALQDNLSGGFFSTAWDRLRMLL